MLDVGSFLSEIGSARGALSAGIGMTVLLAAGGLSIGLMLGALLAVFGVYGPPPMQAAVAGYVFVLRGVPLLVTLLFVFFGLGRVWRSLPAEIAAVVAMGLFSGAYIAEIFRGALQSITRAQIDAARAIGLPFLDRFCHVVLPLALRRAIPSLTNIAVDMVKATTLVAALGVSDLLQTGQQIAMRSLLIPEFYFGMWAAYVAINLGITAIGRWCEARFRHVAF
jgi:His/Glu/Gln/Arg/opine family amino acid ABC transporter permease subunit